jgi:hypothetical protein
MLTSSVPTFATVSIVNDANGNAPLYYIPITITNSQTNSTGANFQCKIDVNSNTHSTYYASDLKNVCFEDGNGHLLTSWLESGETSTSTDSVYWVLLPTSISGSGGAQLIYECLVGTSQNSMDGVTTGAEPTYTGTYGQYDNGNNTFDYYENFSGVSLDSNWVTIGSGTVTVNNGLTLSAGGPFWFGVESTYITSEPIVLEYLGGQFGGGYGPAIGVVLYASYEQRTPDVTTGWGVEPAGGNGGSSSYNTWYLVTANHVNLAQSIYTNYTNFQMSSSLAVTGGHLTLTAFSTTQAEYSWCRVRQYPPNGVLPSVSFGSLTPVGPTPTPSPSPTPPPYCVPTGNGTASNPFVICNVSNLQNMSNNLSAYYVLGQNINASATSGWNGGTGFVPIGNVLSPFTGNFNGENYTITNLYINNPSAVPAGLFGGVSSASINYVGLVNEYIYGDSYIGGLIGYMTGGTVSGSYSTGSIAGYSYVGGLIGYISGGTVNNSYSTSNISGTNKVGGLIGQMQSGLVNDSYSAGSVSSSGPSVGGFMGYKSGGTITSCYYDSITSGQSDTSKGTPKTTAQMKQQSTFVGWDFTTPIWYMVNGSTYPLLFYQNPATSAPTIVTLNATYVASAQAQLNAYLSNDGGGTCIVSFQYAHWNGSAWVGNTTTAIQSGFSLGSYINQVITGLSNNTEYTFRAMATNSYGSANGSWITFNTTSSTLYPPTGLFATTTYDTIALYWTMGLNSSYTSFTYKIGVYPSNLNDGTLVGNVSGTGYTVTGLSAGNVYYFSFWGTDGIGNYSANASYIMVTTPVGPSTTTNNTTLPPVNVSGFTNPPNGSALTKNPLYAFINAMDDAGVGMPHDTWWVLLTIGMMVVCGLYIVARYRNLMVAMIAVIVIGVIASDLGIFPIWVLYLFGFAGLGLSWKELR